MLRMLNILINFVTYLLVYLKFSYTQYANHRSLALNRLYGRL